MGCLDAVFLLDHPYWRSATQTTNVSLNRPKSVRTPPNNLPLSQVNVHCYPLFKILVSGCDTVGHDRSCTNETDRLC